MSWLKGVFKWGFPILNILSYHHAKKRRRRLTKPPSPNYAKLYEAMKIVPQFKIPNLFTDLKKDIDIKGVGDYFYNTIRNEMKGMQPFLNVLPLQSQFNLLDTLHDVISKATLRNAEALGQGMVAYRNYKNQLNNLLAQSLMGWWYWNKRNNSRFNPLLSIFGHRDFGKPTYGWW